MDLGEAFGLDPTDDAPDATGGVEFWILDARRPWNLGNVFGGSPLDTALGETNGIARSRNLEVEFGEIKQNYKPGKGGVIVLDDGDIGEELAKEREAYFKLEQMPEIEDNGRESDYSESDSEGEGSVTSSGNRKRKRGSDAEDDENEEESERPQRRQRSSSVGLSFEQVLTWLTIFAAGFIVLGAGQAWQKRTCVQLNHPKLSKIAIAYSSSTLPPD